MFLHIVMCIPLCTSKAWLIFLVNLYIHYRYCTIVVLLQYIEYVCKGFILFMFTQLVFRSLILELHFMGVSYICLCHLSCYIRNVHYPFIYINSYWNYALCLYEHCEMNKFTIFVLINKGCVNKLKNKLF